MTKYRSSQNFKSTYDSFKQGIAIGIDNFIHLKEEATPGTFLPPSIGTQGSSISDTSPSTDISGGAATTFRINVDGVGVVSITLVLTGLTTGAAIAAAIELAVNTALSAAGYDARIVVSFASVYTVKSQKTGTRSSVVITAGLSNDVAAALKLGVANSGVEAVGTNGTDFCYATKASVKMAQDIQASEHKSGRQTYNVIKKKKMSDGDLETYFNVAASGNPAVDAAIDLLLTGLFGVKTAIGSSEIRYDSTQPQSKFFSLVQGNNAFARYFNGCYVKSGKFTLPGSGEAKMQLPLKARDGLYASIAKLQGLVSASATITLVAGQSPRFDVGVPVMAVDPDGRTVLAGQDGSLTVLSRVDGSDQIVLSSSVSIADAGYIVPWLPHVFDQTGTDNPVTGLQGTVSFDGGSTTVEEVNNLELTMDPQLEDFDNWYGFDTNKGYAVGNKSKIDVKADIVMSASQAKHIIYAKEFTAANVVINLGPSAGRHIKWVFPRVFFKVPDCTIPDSGTVKMTLEGEALETFEGALDAVKMSYL